MIRSGITTINDIWYEPEGLAEAAEAAGLRAQIALKLFDVKLEELYANRYERVATEGEERLRRGVDFVEKYAASKSGLVTGRIGPHATDTCSPELHIEACAEAGRLGVGLHTHVAQSKQEVEYCQSTYKKGPAEFLADLDVLSHRSILAHLTFASDTDLDLITQSKARYAHCPTIYPRRGVYPDLQGIQDRRIVTGIATDWMMNDPFVVRRVGELARRVRAEAADGPAAELGLAWRLVFGRGPSDFEQRTGLQFLENETAAVRRSSPKNTDPALTALSHLCHALVSSNGFLYVD